MKKYYLLIIIGLIFTACTFEDISSPVDENDETPGTPEGIEITTQSMSAIWKVESYDIGVFSLSPANAPLQYIRLTDSTFFNSSNDFRGNLVFNIDSVNSSQDTVKYIENDFTFWRVVNGNVLRFENEFDASEVYRFEIEELTGSKLILSEEDSDEILAVFSKTNMTYAELQDMIKMQNDEALK
jgi:hypothetical protein